MYEDGERERERERSTSSISRFIVIVLCPSFPGFVCIYIYVRVCVRLSAITRRRCSIIPRVRRIRSPNFSSRIRSNTIIAHSCISSVCILCYSSTDNILLLNYTVPTYIIVPNSIRKIWFNNMLLYYSLRTYSLR